MLAVVAAAGNHHIPQGLSTSSAEQNKENTN